MHRFCFIGLALFVQLLPGLLYAQPVVPGVDDRYENLQIDYEVIVQEDLDAIFAPDTKIKGISYSGRGGVAAEISCTERARNCQLSTDFWQNRNFVLSSLDEDGFYYVRTPRGLVKRKMVKASTGHFYVIDHTYAKPEIVFKLFVDE